MSYTHKPYLPGVLGWIAKDIGQDVAVALAKARGGRMIWIPKSPKPDHLLSRIVGLENAKKISALLGQGDLKVPNGSLGGTVGRRYRIEELHNRGFSAAHIAGEVDVNMRTVERVIERMRKSNQPSLPF